MNETKPCPNCGAKMIKERTGISTAACPPHIYLEWWCGCGHKEDAGYVRPPTEHEQRMERWKRLNEGKP